MINSKMFIYCRNIDVDDRQIMDINFPLCVYRYNIHFLHK